MHVDGSLPADFDGVLAAVQLMTPAEREAVAIDAISLTGSAVWVPNPGPQTDAYYSKADVLLYGGSAGCGKTGLLVGLSLTAHKRTLFLRRTNKEASKIRDAYEQVLGHSEGWNGQDDCWRLPDGRLIQVGGCQMEDDKQKYKGSPYDLYCVGRGTKVLMGDGSYRPIETLEVGEHVQTLEGPRRIQRVYPVQRKPAVEVTAKSEAGVVIARQVQSCSHAILCETDWFSADDLVDACASTEFQSGGSTELWSGSQSLRLSRYRPAPIRDFQRMAGHALRSTANHVESAIHAFCEQSIPGSDSVVFANEHAGMSPLPLSFFQSTHSGSAERSVSQDLRPPFPLSADVDVRSRSLLAGWIDRYLFGSGRRDARIQQSLDRVNASGAGQRCVLRQDDAAQPTPIHLQGDDAERTQTRNHRRGTYFHPYTQETRRVDESCSVQVSAWEARPVGVVDLFDLQIEEVNHFITEGGFVNKNCVDEGCDFTESQFTFITTWNRSADKNQRCRAIIASNPPTNEEGRWLIRYFAPWLDPSHSNPAKPGELRWFLVDKEVDGPGPHLLDGKPTMAQSRTFIPGKLSDNPDLAQTNYDATLARLPIELRRAYRDGSFMISGKRDAFQVFDPEWVRAAFRRWSPIPPHGSVMSSIACDIAQGGEDNAVLAMRYGYWFDRLRKKPGKEMTKGSDIAGFVLAHRRDNCPVTLDLTGGYGGAAYEIMKSNDIEVYGFQGTAGSTKLTKDGQYKFPNRRCEIYWMLREALDPDQPGGSQIALPESRQLFEDLTILRWEPTIKGIQITPKERVVELLNRSPDEGDAVAICWSRGIKVYKPNVEFNPLEQGMSARPSTIVDLGTRRQLSIVGGRRR